MWTSLTWPTCPIRTASKAFRIGLGLLLGLILGIGGAFLIEAVNTSIRRPEDLEVMMQVPGLAVIPRLTPQAARPRLPGLGGRRKNSAADSRAAALGSATQPFSVGLGLPHAADQPHWSNPGEQLRSLVVTSASPGKGRRSPQRTWQSPLLRTRSECS